MAYFASDKGIEKLLDTQRRLEIDSQKAWADKFKLISGKNYNELSEEISTTIARDPNEIVFTGLHRNTKIGTIDLLGYWKVGINSKDLGNLISQECDHQETLVFETIIQAIEEFVWDTQNIIIDFNEDNIISILEGVGMGIDSLIPEARAALYLALKDLGRLSEKNNFKTYP